MTENEEKKEDVLLTPSEVFSVLEFASSMSRGTFGYGNSMLTTELINSRMKDISLNPQAGTQDTIQKALSDPKNSETELQQFSEYFEIVSQSYKRMISYCANLLAFDLTYTCINAEKEDYTKLAYKKDFKIMQDFFDRFDYHKEFNVAVKEMMRNETFIFSPRLDGNQIVLQELPSSPIYTKITGRWDYGFLVSMNLYWLLLPGISLDMYPPFFKEKYAEFWENGKSKGYNPAISPELRGNSSWVFWQDLPPDVGWCFKLSTELAARIPYFTGLYLSLLDNDLMRNLQRNINLSSANRIIMGEVPMLKDTAAKVRDQFSISAKNLGEFLALVKSAIGDSLKTAAVPLTNVQGITFPPVNDMYQSYLSTSVSQSGINSDLIFTGNARPNILTSQLSVNADEQLMEVVYPQFEAFLNWQLSKLTKHYKFKFSFQGSKFFNNREQRLERVMKLVDYGIVLPQQIAAALGLSPFSFTRELEEARALGFVDKLTPIIMAAQQSGAESGQPKKSSSDLGESGSQSRGDGSNIARGSKI